MGFDIIVKLNNVDLLIEKIIIKIKFDDFLIVDTRKVKFVIIVVWFVFGTRIHSQSTWKTHKTSVKNKEKVREVYRNSTSKSTNVATIRFNTFP